MTVEDYIALPKWKGKIFMQDEKTCFNDGFAEGYKECDKKLDDAKSIIESLLKNRPDTYSGTNIELQQKKMFAFQNAVEQAYALLKE